MPDDMEPTSQKQVTLIPTDRVRVLNPRVRNRRTFEAMVDNIARVVEQKATPEQVLPDMVAEVRRLLPRKG